MSFSSSYGKSSNSSSGFISSGIPPGVIGCREISLYENLTLGSIIYVYLIVSILSKSPSNSATLMPQFGQFASIPCTELHFQHRHLVLTDYLCTIVALYTSQASSSRISSFFSSCYCPPHCSSCFCNSSAGKYFSHPM